MKFQVFKTRKKQWRWRLRATNGRIVANSGESYHRLKDCLSAMGLVKNTNGQTPAEFEDTVRKRA